jgi:hypothetical protein
MGAKRTESDRERGVCTREDNMRREKAVIQPRSSASLNDCLRLNR